MNFEYKVCNKGESNFEHHSYISYKSPLSKMIKICTYVPAMALIGMVLYCLIAKIKIPFYISLWIVAFEITLITSMVLIIDYKRNKSKKVKNSKFIDSDSIFKVTIDDDVFTKESEYSFFQLPLTCIRSIDLLKHEVVINFNSFNVFITKDSIPVSIDEFIEILKKKNSNIKVSNYTKKIKREKVQTVLAMAVTIIICTIMAFFSVKHEQNKDIDFNSLITQSDLKEGTSGYTYHYRNKALGLSIDFPKKWEDHYGINENGDTIEVYYLSKGTEGKDAFLLFTVEKGEYDESLGGRLIGSAYVNYTTYSIYASSKKDTFLGSRAEYKEYKSMLKQVPNLKIR